MGEWVHHDRVDDDRWQAETGIGDLKTEQRGGPETVLRSKSPDMVEQEFWAMLLCLPGHPRPDRPSRTTRPGPDPHQLQTRPERRPGLRHPGGSPPTALTRALAHAAAGLTERHQPGPAAGDPG